MRASVSDAVARGRPEAAAAITPPIDRRANDAMRTGALRRSGVLRALVAFACAATLAHFDRWIASGIAATLGSLTLALALASPTKGYVALTRAVEHVGEWIGAVLAWVLLTPVFLFFFVPYGLGARRGRGDRIGRAFDRSAKTYWITRPAKTDAEQRAELERPY